MGDINSLPTAGHNFKAKYGTGNFATKLKRITRHGDNLGDNVDSIVKVVSDRQGIIRRGSLSRLQQRDMRLKIVKLEKQKGNMVTKKDNEDIKELLKHVGQRSRVSGKSSDVSDFLGKSNKAGKSKIKPWLMARDTVGDVEQITGIDASGRYVGALGNRDQVMGNARGGVKGSVSDLGIKGRNVGFAGQYNKSSSSPAPLNGSPKPSIGPSFGANGLNNIFKKAG